MTPRRIVTLATSSSELAKPKDWRLRKYAEELVLDQMRLNATLPMATVARFWSGCLAYLAREGAVRYVAPEYGERRRGGIGQTGRYHVQLRSGITSFIGPQLAGAYLIGMLPATKDAR